MKEPQYRVENGRKIYTMESRVDCLVRPTPAKPLQKNTNTQLNSVVGDAEASTPQSSEYEDPDVVSVHMRLITANDAYPSVGWLGPQRVKYGHNNGQAAREIPELMNSATRPVPLMWNHSYDAKDIAGRVNDAYWENSSDILPGANGWARVNRNFDPKAAMGLETGEINATSIGVVMEKERSHPDMPFDQFVQMAAEGAQFNGEDVAWLPVKTLEVIHHALVWSGADPNSGPREITNGDNADSKYGTVVSTESKLRGGSNMADTKAIEILNSLCKDLGFDVILSESNIPDDLQTRIQKRVEVGAEALSRYSEIESRLARIKIDVLPADNQTAPTLDTLNALIDRLSLAKYGESYLSDLRKDALAAFDGAKTDPANKPELSLAEKTVRGVIESTTDIDALKAWIAEYSNDKQDKFLQPDLHTSADEGLPPIVGAADVTAEQRKIAASFNRWQGGK
jgi:hypothetical protein